METLKQVGVRAPDDAIQHIKPPASASALVHRELVDGPFWKAIPAYREVDEATFLDHEWQARNSITNSKKLLAAIQDIAPQAFIDDVTEGFRRAPMALRV